MNNFPYRQKKKKDEVAAREFSLVACLLFAFCPTHHLNRQQQKCSKEEAGTNVVFYIPVE